MLATPSVGRRPRGSDFAEGEVAPSSHVYRDGLLAHNAIVVAGTVLAGLLGGVVFLGVFSHRLQPAEYGAVFTVITLMNLVGVPASALTLLMARETSRNHASGRHAPSTALLREGNQTLLLFGLVLAALLAAMSPLLAGFLDVPVGLLLAAAAGMPFTLALPLLLGEFQGSQRFLAFAGVSAGQAGLKLAAAVLLGLGLGPAGVIGGISVGTLVAYLIALRMLRRKLALKPRWPWLRPAISYLGVVVPSTLAIAILLSADVVMVKHFFAARVAGEYSAVAALGRAIFFGASGVAAVLFPKITFHETRREGGSHLVLGSLALVVLGGLSALLLITIAARPVLIAFAGVAYVPGSEYLGGYALAMTLLGAAVVLIATHQSRGKAAFLAIVVPITLLEPGLIIVFHNSPVQVVQVIDGCMALLVGGLSALALIEARIVDRAAVSRASIDTFRPSPLPRVQTLPVQLRA
jgi:O-antigen/teichoic acid export membrane protein